MFPGYLRIIPVKGDFFEGYILEMGMNYYLIVSPFSKCEHCGQSFPRKLEKYRVKTKDALVYLGQQRHHCIGSHANTGNLFFVFDTVCAEVSPDFTRIRECHDAFNKVTPKVKRFSKFLERSFRVWAHSQGIEMPTPKDVTVDLMYDGIIVGNQEIRGTYGTIDNTKTLQMSPVVNNYVAASIQMNNRTFNLWSKSNV